MDTYFVFCGRLLCVESFSAIEYGCNTINTIDVLLTVGIRTLVMILDVKRVKNANNFYSGCLSSNNFALSDRKNNNY
mgnify:CR=1 FL=1